MSLSKKLRLYYLFKFVQNAHFFAAVLVPFFTIWGGLNTRQVLLIQSWFMISVTLLEIPTGFVADRFGRRLSLILGAISASIGFLLYGLYPNIYLFLVSESILALAMAFISGADEAWLIDTLNQHRKEKLKTEVIGKGQSAMFAGMILGSVLGSIIASRISLPATMYLSVIPSLMLLMIALRLPEPINAQTPGEVFRWKQAVVSLRYIISHPVLRLLVINVILVAIPAYFVIWLYQPLLQSIGVNIIWFGAIHAGFIVVELLIAHRFGWLEKKVGFAGYLRISALLAATGFLILVFKVNMASILLMLILSGGFGLTRRYFAIGKFHDYIPTTYRASIASSFSLLLRLSIAIANVIVGWLFVRSVETTVLILGLLAFIAAITVPGRHLDPS
jgi:MFS family permease